MYGNLEMDLVETNTYLTCTKDVTHEIGAKMKKWDFISDILAAYINVCL